MRSARACLFVPQSRQSITQDCLNTRFASPRKSSIAGWLPQAKQQSTSTSPQFARRFPIIGNLASTRGADHREPVDVQPHLRRDPQFGTPETGSGSESESAPERLTPPGAAQRNLPRCGRGKHARQHRVHDQLVTTDNSRLPTIRQPNGVSGVPCSGAAMQTRPAGATNREFVGPKILCGPIKHRTRQIG
jgi:hypothetical protein